MTSDAFFLQIHLLTPYNAVLLNRDDVGRAKRMPLGGASRVRVSSQCLKRHWREAVSDWSLDKLSDARTVRSRKIISREVARPLVEEDGVAVDDAIAVLDAIKAALLGESKRARAEKSQRKSKEAELPIENSSLDALEKRLEVLDTNQVIVLGRPEIDFIRKMAGDVLATGASDLDKTVKDYLKSKETKGNLEAMRLACGLDAALFGRMVTSDVLARGDAAVHVAHALTVHAEEAEPDYFVAVDDLTREAGELGTGLIQTAELTSGLFYGYVVVDVPLLVGNLSDDPELSARVIEHLLHLTAKTSPGAKLGSTAPYGYADLVMVEAGRRQPRSLMSAFHEPVRKTEVRENAIAALADHLQRFDTVYGADEDRRVVSLLDAAAVPGEPVDGGLAALASWAADRVRAEAG